MLRSSTAAIDGQRYFVLFDDALISMRYAWNLAHGNGFVWNIGERIEGYTNPLMTLIMGVPNALLPRNLAPLAIQLLGILTVLVIAGLMPRLSEMIAPSRDAGTLGRLTRIAVLAYYPISFWTVMGMETGLLTLLLCMSVLAAFEFEQRPQPKIALRLGALLWLSYMTRPDAVIYAAVIAIYLVWRTRQWRMLVLTASVYGIFIGLHLVFRMAYYGELVPNTYILKMEGMPLAERLQNGIGFLGLFVVSVFPLWIGLAVCFKRRLHARDLLLLALFESALLYQIWAGGDPWPYWRMLVPVMPFAFMLAMQGTLPLIDQLRRYHFSRRGSKLVVGLLLVLAAFNINQPFMEEITYVSPYGVDTTWREIDRSLALDRLVSPTAAIGVFYAGALPYYSERYAIDFLGKADAIIAHLSPDLSGSISWAGMNSVPGHNKYDLHYSIEQRTPDYVEQFYWGRQNVSDWMNYRHICLNKSSLFIRTTALKGVYGDACPDLTGPSSYDF